MSNGDMPASPRAHQIIDANATYFKVGCKGLTKREYFAGQAMQGYLSCPNNSGKDSELAEVSVLAAEALLKELEK